MCFEYDTFLLMRCVSVMIAVVVVAALSGVYFMVNMGTVCKVAPKSSVEPKMSVAEQVHSFAHDAMWTENETMYNK